MRTASDLAFISNHSRCCGTLLASSRANLQDDFPREEGHMKGATFPHMKFPDDPTLADQRTQRPYALDKCALFQSCSHHYGGATPRLQHWLLGGRQIGVRYGRLLIFNHSLTSRYRQSVTGRLFGR